MEQTKTRNLITSSNGVSIIEASSCRLGCTAFSLINNDKGVWVSEEGLPQSVTLEISSLSKYDLNYFGWYCWHIYKSNPAVIELLISFDYTNTLL
jgi:hypothetical protein